MTDEREKEQAERQLPVLEAVLAALERRQEVLEALWVSRDREDAAERLRTLLEIPDGTPCEAVLDLQLLYFTTEGRQKLARHAAALREVLGRA